MTTPKNDSFIGLQLENCYLVWGTLKKGEVIIVSKETDHFKNVKMR